MEWVEVISQLVSNVGFPIACCAVMFYLAYKFGNSLNTGLAEVKAGVDSIAQSIAKLSESIDKLLEAGGKDG